MSYIEKSIEECIEDTEECYEEVEETEEVQAPVPQQTKKAKKPRTQKQIDSLQKAREARAKNLALTKQQKAADLQATAKAAPQTLVPALAAIKEKQPKKKSRRKIVIQQQEEESSSDEEVIVIRSKARKKKPKKKRQVYMQQPLDESSDEEEQYYEESQPTFRFI